MLKTLFVSLLLVSSLAHSIETEYWEQVFLTSIDSQIAAKQANFTLLPVEVVPSSSFGMRQHPLANENRMHRGVDLPAEEGTPFVAVAHGVVVYAGERGGLGNLIAIDHGDGLVTRYGHAQSLLLEVGDEVRRGEVIGTVGSTGLVTGPHVHYEIIQNGAFLDPEIFIEKRTELISGSNLEYLRQAIINTKPIDINEYVETLLVSKSVSPKGNSNHHKQQFNTQNIDACDKGNTTVTSIKTGRTIWALAEDIRPADTTVFQAMIAIYNANPRAFIDNNINKRLIEIPINLPCANAVIAIDHVEARAKYYDDLKLLNRSSETHIDIALSTSVPKNERAPL